MGLIGTQVPEDVFQYVSKNAGIIANAFDPNSGTLKRADIKGATTGGISFADKPTYKDNGDDIDNMPPGTMEMKEEESREITCSGTFVSVTPHAIKDLVALADISEDEATITPRNTLKLSDFQDHLWFITDYGRGGYIAIRMDNVLNEDGLSLKSTNKGKGQYAFNFKAHYSMDNIDEVPYEIFIKKGTIADDDGDEPHSDATN